MFSFLFLYFFTFFFLKTIITGKRLWDPEKDRLAASGSSNEENVENGLEFEERPEAFNL